MATNAGMSLTQLAVDSLMRSRICTYDAPIAATANYLVTTVDPNGVAVGGTFTLTTAGSLMFRKARRITMTITDDDVAGGLSLTVRITGQRWGMDVSEILTVTSVDNTATLGTSVNCYDEVTEIKLLAKTADAGDDVTFGISKLSFGLDFPIDFVSDVQSIINVVTATESAAVAVSATSVIVVATGGSVAGGSYITQGTDLATTHHWTIRYLTSRKFDGSGVVGGWR